MRRTKMCRRSFHLVAALALAGGVTGFRCDCPAVFTLRDTPVDIACEAFRGCSDLEIAQPPEHGMADIDIVGCSVRYTPAPDFPAPGGEGTDEFTVTVDKHLGRIWNVRVPVVVRPPYVLPGCAFGPYQTDPRQPVTEQELEEGLRFAATYCERVRFYGLSDDLFPGPRMAKKLGLRVVAGAEISNDFSLDAKEIRRLIQVGKQHVAGQRVADVLLVGNETQFHARLPWRQLVSYIRYVAHLVPHVPVTTSEVDDLLLRTLKNDPESFAELDRIYAHIHPWHRGVPVEHAVDYVIQRHEELAAKFHPREIVVSEVGWRSADGEKCDAVASVPKLEDFLLDLRACTGGCTETPSDPEFFYFELADEPWKGDDDGWGIFDSNWVMKEHVEQDPEKNVYLRDVFECQPATSDCSGKIFDSDSASIKIVTGPDCDPLTECDDYVKGTVSGVGTAGENSRDYNVFVYIGMNGQYYIRPWDYDPISHISPDGTFRAKVLQFSNDRYATEVVAFLVEKDHHFQPPTEYSSPGPPEELAHLVLASDSMLREPCPPVR